MPDEQTPADGPATPPDPEHERISELRGALACAMDYLAVCGKRWATEAQQDPGPEDYDLRAIDACAFAHQLLDAFHTDLLLHARWSTHGIHVPGPPGPTIHETVSGHLHDAVEAFIADLSRYLDDDRREVRQLRQFGRPRL